MSKIYAKRIYLNYKMIAYFVTAKPRLFDYPVGTFISVKNAIEKRSKNNIFVVFFANN